MEKNGPTEMLVRLVCRTRHCARTIVKNNTPPPSFQQSVRAAKINKNPSLPTLHVQYKVARDCLENMVRRWHCLWPSVPRNEAVRCKLCGEVTTVGRRNRDPWGNYLHARRCFPWWRARISKVLKHDKTLAALCDAFPHFLGYCSTKTLGLLPVDCGPPFQPVSKMLPRHRPRARGTVVICQACNVVIEREARRGLDETVFFCSPCGRVRRRAYRRRLSANRRLARLLEAHPDAAIYLKNSVRLWLKSTASPDIISKILLS